jgi:hypothetical protein
MTRAHPNLAHLFATTKPPFATFNLLQPITIVLSPTSAILLTRFKLARHQARNRTTSLPRKPELSAISMDQRQSVAWQQHALQGEQATRLLPQALDVMLQV